jgi:hypothetical protein
LFVLINGVGDGTRDCVGAQGTKQVGMELVELFRDDVGLSAQGLAAEP